MTVSICHPLFINTIALYQLGFGEPLIIKAASVQTDGCIVWHPKCLLGPSTDIWVCSACWPVHLVFTWYKEKEQTWKQPETLQAKPSHGHRTSAIDTGPSLFRFGGECVLPLRTTAESSAAEALAELMHGSTAPSAPLLWLNNISCARSVAGRAGGSCQASEKQHLLWEETHLQVVWSFLLLLERCWGSGGLGALLSCLWWYCVLGCCRGWASVLVPSPAEELGGAQRACKILKQCTKYLLAKKAVRSKILLDCLAFRGHSVNKVAWAWKELETL